MNKLLFALVTSSFVLISSSCATIVTGKTDTLAILSDPSGADFVTNSGLSGTTPAELEVPSEEDITFTFTKAGFKDSVVLADSYMSKWVWGNLLFGGLIGVIVDFSTDTSHTHDKTISAVLPPA